MTADLAVSAALEALAASLDELGVPAMLIGGIAVIARGDPPQPRTLHRARCTLRAAPCT